jgi:hypothetical protein
MAETALKIADSKNLSIWAMVDIHHLHRHHHQSPTLAALLEIRLV